MKLTRPMLAADTPSDLSQLTFPLYASIKADGIRCVMIDGQPFSRSLKPIRNRYIATYLAEQRLPNLDGELVVGAMNDPQCMNRTSSGVMSADGQPDFAYHVFDLWDHPGTYHQRHAALTEVELPARVVRLSQQYVTSLGELEELEQQVLAQGHEGLIVRSPNAMYKAGRATPKSQGLTKLKRFADAEALVVGYEERLHNANEATTNALGYTERSSHMANRTPMGTLGALRAQLSPEIEFSIGTGFTDELRSQLWQGRDSLIGKVARYKYFPTGSKERPRHPVFLGFRDLEDL